MPDHHLQLVARIAEARQGWLEIERLTDAYLDDELDNRVALVRLAILDTNDRLHQLIETEAVPA